LSANQDQTPTKKKKKLLVRHFAEDIIVNSNGQISGLWESLITTNYNKSRPQASLVKISGVGKGYKNIWAMLANFLC
jgi:hypothetical protein